MIKITECPRDAMQGISNFIPTSNKVKWLNALLKVGYDILDFGSFVSPKAIPQLKDTELVLEQLNFTDSNTKLLAIIPNLKGAERACRHETISYLGYPHSISNTFLQRNINSNIDESRRTIMDIADQCDKTGKELQVYISMCFGNIYGEEWHPEMVVCELDKLHSMGVLNVSLADTSGVGTPDNIGQVFNLCKKHFPDMEFNLHLHTTPTNWYEKVDAAYQNGCDHFHTVMNGMGGCPMAASKMVGNLNTSLLLKYMEKNNIHSTINKIEYNKASYLTFELFQNYSNLQTYP